MDSRDEINTLAMEAGEQADGQLLYPDNCVELLEETGHNKIVLHMMLEDYIYYIIEEFVSGMHLPMGKPHQPDQLII